MKTVVYSIIVAATLLSSAAQAAPSGEATQESRFYVGGSIGRSNFSLQSSNVAVPSGKPKGDTRGNAAKLYAGYRFTETFGLEAGYARLGHVSRWGTADGQASLRGGTAQAFYGSATAHVALGDFLALNTRLGVARGKISGDQGISGNGTGVMAGIGAEYRISKNISATADYDYFGKLSPQVKGGILTVGLRANF